MQPSSSIVFWKGSKIETVKLIEFLESQNIRLVKTKETSPTVVQINDNSILRIMTVKEIDKIISSHLKNLGEDNALNQFLDRYKLTPKILNSIKEIEYKGSLSDELSSYVYYKNGVVKITKEKIQIIPYLEYKGNVFEEEINQRDFNLKTRPIGDFQDFVFKLSDENNKRYSCFKAMIGYLLHSFKIEDEAYVIILVDKNIDGNTSKGRTGKSLILRGLEHIVNTHFENGKQLNAIKFMFQSVKKNHKVIVINDIKKGFRFEEIYNIAVEEFKIEGKGEKPIILPFSESPKIAITSNFIIQNSFSSSDNDRRADYEVSDYFMTKKPRKVYGKLFFKHWNKKEWEKFDAFMAECQQEFLINGVTPPETINLASNLLEQETSKEFVQFMDNSIKAEKEYDKEVEYQRFIKEYKLNDCTKHNFTKWMKIYSNIKKLTFKKRDSNGKTFFKFVDEINEAY